MGVLAAAAIGLVVMMGTTQSFIQQRVNLLALEKRIARIEVNSRGADGSQMFMGRAWDCKNTLAGIPLSGNAGDAKRSFEIALVKDSGSPPGAVWDFSRDAISGELTNSAAKEGLKKAGIDKFKKLEFIYESASPRSGRIVLTSGTSIQGIMEKSNPSIVWELSGIKVESKPAEAGPPALPAGDRVTECSGEPVLDPCGPGVAGDYHTNPDNSKGGFVADTAKANVDATAFIGPDAAVCDTATVKSSARIEDTARIFGSARIVGGKVHGKARVYDNAWIAHTAEVYGEAEIKDSAQVFNQAKVYGQAKVSDSAKISGGGEVYGSAHVYDSARVSDGKIHGRARVYGRSMVYGEVYGNAKVYEYATLNRGVKIYHSARVFGDAVISDRAEIFGEADVYGEAKIKNQAKVSYSSRVYGRAEVYNRAHVKGYKAKVYGDAKIYNRAHVTGGSVYDQARVYGQAHVSGGSVYQSARIYGRAYINSGKILGSSRVSGRASIISHRNLKVIDAVICNGIFAPAAASNSPAPIRLRQSGCP